LPLTFSVKQLLLSAKGIHNLKGRAGAMVVPQILIVEDERSIADTLQKIFTVAGYGCRAFRSAEEFLATDDTAWAPSFALIDVVLPGMNGLELATLLQAKFPGLELSLFSGQTETTAILQTAAAKGVHFPILAKPVHPTELLRLIHEALNADSSALKHSA